MNILALESSAVSASAAVLADGELVAEEFVHTGLTHSETLAPLMARAIEKSGLQLFDMDLVAVTHGPGSFTGVRIGVALAKGVAQPMEIPCLGVSTLEAAAFGQNRQGELILACMDARRDQLYAAFFEGDKQAPKRLRDDAALSAEETAKILIDYQRPAVVTGDGAPVFLSYLRKNNIDLPVYMPPGESYYQRASFTARAAEYEILHTGRTPVSPKFLAPVYLRMPQAERERKKRLERSKS